MTTIEEAKDYFIGRCEEIISMSTRGDAWVFLCGAAMIDYLTQMTTGTSGRTAYIDFVERYFKEVNINYKDFEYQNGMKDLPTQMYIILRCGIVHKFSFVPGSQEIANGGRLRSILLSHEINGSTHFAKYTNNGIDSVIFTAEQFSKDIKSVVEIVFTKAKTDMTLERNIRKYIVDYPPIQGKFN